MKLQLPRSISAKRMLASVMFVYDILGQAAKAISKCIPLRMRIKWHLDYSFLKSV